MVQLVRKVRLVVGIQCRRGHRVVNSNQQITLKEDDETMDIPLDECGACDTDIVLGAVRA